MMRPGLCPLGLHSDESSSPVANQQSIMDMRQASICWDPRSNKERKGVRVKRAGAVGMLAIPGRRLELLTSGANETDGGGT